MQSLPIAPSGYTLHILTTAPRTHIARIVQPDGRVAGEWTTTCSTWQLKNKVTALRESLEAGLGAKATLPTYYGELALAETHAPIATTLQPF